MLSQARKDTILKLLTDLDVQVDDIELIDEALTHPSFNFEENRVAPDYERLEFLGDSVLRLSVSTLLFDKYPAWDEGKLTKLRSYLVSDEFLSKIAVGINLNSYINIGLHEEKDGGRDKESIIACAMEAFLGALYKSKGFNFTKDFIYKIYNSIEINYNEIFLIYNSKELLQQYTQGKNKDLPEYKIIKESGSAHKKIYETAVFYEGKELGRGVSKTKKEAEKLAALNALKTLNILGDENNE